MFFDIFLLIVLAMNVYVLIGLVQVLGRLRDTVGCGDRTAAALIHAVHRLADGFERWSRHVVLDVANDLEGDDHG